jgi:hypothetical protein
MDQTTLQSKEGTVSRKHEATFRTLGDNLKWQLDLLRQIEELKENLERKEYLL